VLCVGACRPKSFVKAQHRQKLPMEAFKLHY
jgi:hypothetical protein